MSQFTIYKWSDVGAPVFFGTTGSLVALFDACLVNGYGTQPGAGWLKPFPNTSSVTGSSVNTCGGWQQPTGSGLFLFVNDGQPNGTALYKEAWAIGWENLVAPSASVFNTCGSGSGQFPLPSQTLTTGHTVVRKSTTSDAVNSRNWIVVADSSSFYSFIQTNDTANVYYGFGFGDIYSFRNINTNGTDAYRCIIMGRNAENTNAAGNESFDLFTSIASSTNGQFMARSFTQVSQSLPIGKHGDSVKGSSTTYLGNIPFPNPADSGLYVSPVWVVESGTSTIRGQLRGIYQPLHPIASGFVDGQAFNGALDYAGKTFMVIKPTPNSGMYVIETSNTVAMS